MKLKTLHIRYAFIGSFDNELIFLIQARSWQVRCVGYPNLTLLHSVFRLDSVLNIMDDIDGNTVLAQALKKQVSPKY